MVIGILQFVSHRLNKKKESKSAKNVEVMTPHSPDLSLCDLFLFPNNNTKMGGERFLSPEAVERFRSLFSEISASKWTKCFANWFECMQKCNDIDILMSKAKTKTIKLSRFLFY